MSLSRLVKKVGKVVKGAVKVAAPIAASFVPIVGGQLSNAIGTKIAEKDAKKAARRSGNALGIATQVLESVAPFVSGPKLSAPAITPQESVTAEVQPAEMRFRRRVGSMRYRERAAPNQFDAVTPLGEAQAAALPSRTTETFQPLAPAQVGASLRSPGTSRTITGAPPVSIASTAGRVLGALTGQLTQYAQARGGGQRGLSMSGSALRARSSGNLVPLPGAGFQTVGGFGTTAAGVPFSFGMRKRRRMNPTNVHALRRSLRRVESFVKLEKRVDKIVNRLSKSRGRANRSGFVRKRAR